MFRSAVVVLLISLPLTSAAEIGLDNDFFIEDYSYLEGKMTTIGDAPWHVIFLNFDGAKIEPGPNDSRANTSPLVASALDYPAKQKWDTFGGKAKGTKDIKEKLVKIFATVAVKVVTTRPAAGNYTMAMIGGVGNGIKTKSSDPKQVEKVAGVAILDCKEATGSATNNTNKNDIVFIFGDKFDWGVSKIATVIAHELGHSFGLEHIKDANGIMAPSAGGSQGHWVASQTESDAICNKGTQDAQKYLEDTLGKGKQDLAPPRLWFIRPGNGAVMPQDFSFEVTAGDDLGLEHVTIYVDGAKKVEAFDPPFTGILIKVADGEHTLKAHAFDWIGNKTEASITITVNSNCVGTGSCHGGTGGIHAPCTDGAECITGICAVKDGKGLCADTCDASAETPVCPAGLTCNKVAEQDACTPADGYSLAMASGEDGGCQVGTNPGSCAKAGLLLGAVVLLGLAWRRRQSRLSRAVARR